MLPLGVDVLVALPHIETGPALEAEIGAEAQVAGNRNLKSDVERSGDIVEEIVADGDAGIGSRIGRMVRNGIRP